MKKLWTVFKNELMRYFISPLAYIYLVSFLILNAVCAFYFGHLFETFHHLTDSDLCGFLFRVAVNACADGGEGDCQNTVCHSHFHRFSVATCKFFGLAIVAAAPDGADGVNHVPRGQIVAARYLRIACLTAI